MAHLSPAERRAFPYADYIPADVLKSLSRAEACDRLVFSAERARVVKRAGTPGRQRELTREIIAMMSAPPRDSTERAVQQRISKAVAAPDALRGMALRRQAQQILVDHPPAPRNPDAEVIVKAVAEEDGLMACYDENGCLIGICQQSAITPAVMPSEIAKAMALAGGPVSAVVQAQDTGPVRAGGTTGLGRPRQTGPAASAPFDGPQRRLPGEPEDRQVVKSLAQHPREASLLAYGRQVSANYGNGS